jgi:hypothetical protein
MNRPDSPLHRQPKRFRLSLRMLLSIIMVIGFGLGWVVHLAHVERDAVVAIEKIEGKVHDDRDSRVRPSYPPPSQAWPRWLSARAGSDLDGHAVSVNLSIERRMLQWSRSGDWIGS